MYAAKVIADSIAFGVRLTTIEATYPRFILAEDNTHRVFSRNSASSRAIPVKDRIASIRKDAFVPAAFSKNKPGMQADENLSSQDDEQARNIWKKAASLVCDQAELLMGVGVHKEHANRLLEPFAWHTVIKTATEWDNFMNLRCHKGAQPEMRIAAGLMKKARDESAPQELKPGEWHLPYVADHEELTSSANSFEAVMSQEPYAVTMLKISVARCAAISFERQNVGKSIDQYVARHDDLLSSGHMSPFEHQAQVIAPWGRPPFSELWTASRSGAWRSLGHFCGNFRAPWLQYRKTLPGEAVFAE